MRLMQRTTRYFWAGFVPVSKDGDVKSLINMKNEIRTMRL